MSTIHSKAFTLLALLEGVDGVEKIEIHASAGWPVRVQLTPAAFHARFAGCEVTRVRVEEYNHFETETDGIKWTMLERVAGRAATTVIL